RPRHARAHEDFLMVRGGLRSLGVVAAVFAAASLAAPAQAQFRGLLGGSRNTATNDNGDKCSGSNRSTGSRIAGNVLGSLASRAVGNAGGFMGYVPVAEFTDQITASIACRLDPEEQKQAAQATVEATRSSDGSEDGAPEVGQVSEWTSTTRANVSGT